ncbi:MAG: thioredoxin domain-containing protein [Mycetocola sp.]
MVNRLATAISPYLRSHADNPVDWREWGPEAFAEAEARDVPVFLSIGYSTCHWCHVMARESFSDPAIAAVLNAGFVSIKIDREEYPAVDASYLAQAAAFTGQLGWPLSVFTTPGGVAFHAGTYFPPEPMQGHPSFRQVLDAVTDAWVNRRSQVMQNAAAIGEAVSASFVPDGGTLPMPAELDAAVATLAAHEDLEFGGFGGAPKFPVAPVLAFLLASEHALGARTLERMAASPLRDRVEGGFFRYATKRDWSDPHYERMLYDNALLLDTYTTAWVDDGTRAWARDAADGVAGFLRSVMQLPTGGFASAQDSESTIDGMRSEGGYYAADAADRQLLDPPALDEKVLAGWNGLAIAAMARASFVFDRPEWLESARWAADYLLENHIDGDGLLVRASVAERRSAARATLEDYGMLADGLLVLATVTGEPAYAIAGRSLVDGILAPRGGDETRPVFAEPGGGDPVLAGHGLAVAGDPSEGAYPSGISASAQAAWRLHLLTGNRRYLDAATAALEPLAALAVASPVSFGASLSLMRRLTTPAVQLVVVTPNDGQRASLPDSIRRQRADVTAVVTERQAHEFASAGFDLFTGRTTKNGARVAYLCEDFACRLPTAV